MCWFWLSERCEKFNSGISIFTRNLQTYKLQLYSLLLLLISYQQTCEKPTKDSLMKYIFLRVHKTNTKIWLLGEELSIYPIVHIGTQSRIKGDQLNENVISSYSKLNKANNKINNKKYFKMHSGLVVLLCCVSAIVAYPLESDGYFNPLEEAVRLIFN